MLIFPGGNCCVRLDSFAFIAALLALTLLRALVLALKVALIELCPISDDFIIRLFIGNSTISMILLLI